MKHPIASALLAIFLVAIVLPGGLNYSGFCFEQGRWLSDEERIRSAIENINNKSTINFAVRNGTKIELIAPQYLKYANIDDFLKANPDCCKVNPGGPYNLAPPSFIDRITGFNSGDVVAIHFIAHYKHKDGKQQSQLVKSINFQQNCGKALEY